MGLWGHTGGRALQTWLMSSKSPCLMQVWWERGDDRLSRPCAGKKSRVLPPGVLLRFSSGLKFAFNSVFRLVFFSFSSINLFQTYGNSFLFTLSAKTASEPYRTHPPYTVSLWSWYKNALWISWPWIAALFADSEACSWRNMFSIAHEHPRSDTKHLQATSGPHHGIEYIWVCLEMQGNTGFIATGS